MLVPYDVGAIDEGGEVPDPVSQGVSHWTHHQYYVQLLLDALHEIIVDLVLSAHFDQLELALSLGVILDLIYQGDEVLTGEEVGDVAGVQHVVNVL